MKKLNKRKTRLLRVMSLGLIAVVFSVYTIVGVNAKYKSETTATATAQVAKFVILNTDTEQEIIVPELEFNIYDAAGLTKNVDFRVISKSEVSVKYDVIVTLPANKSGDSWLNPTISVKDLSSTPICPDLVVSPDEIDNTFVYTFTHKSLVFGPIGDASETHSIILTLEVDPIFQGNEALLGDISDLPFEIKVHVEQID